MDRLRFRNGPKKTRYNGIAVLIGFSCKGFIANRGFGFCGKGDRKVFFSTTPQAGPFSYEQ